ncbi:IS256 family transposase [Streptomyces sp. NPDC047453]|uniref:IS256 family transposase n=1 Tax=Streptomyces sp. NPDC047453 TaxID=3154812 RepID=UPI003406AAE8
MSTTTDHRIETSGSVSLAVADGSVQGADVKSMPVSPNGLSLELLEELAALAAEKVRGEGLRLMGEGGLLPELTQHLMQAALEAEMDEHLAAEAGRVGGRGSRSGGNMRNGYRAKKVMTEVGAVTVQVPRDRLGTFRPRMLPVYARRTGALDDLVLSLTAKGLTSGEIVSHLAQTYGMTTTKETISTITDKALESMAEWRTRPLDPVYPVVFIDAVHVKIRDGHVANRPVYVAIAVTADGYREILGLWAGDGGEGAKYWQTVLTEIKNRGVRDVLMLVCDGLSALPDAVNTVWPQTVVQTSSVHTPWWREMPAGHRASGRGPMQTRCLRGPHADLSLPLEAGRELASGSCASSAEMRYQRGRPVGDLDRQDGSHGSLVIHEPRGPSRGVRRPRLGQRPSAALPHGRGRPGRAPGALCAHR